MTKKITLWLGLAIVVVAGIMVYRSTNVVESPLVASDGKVSGEYSLESIMSLGKPFVCAFEKNDDNSRIVGTIKTDSKNIFGEFRILTNLVESEFNSFLLMKGEEAYTWTSLAPIGYRSTVAKSASKNASPTQQSQIVGTRDRLAYECEPWATDATIFEAPSWITFSDLK